MTSLATAAPALASDSEFDPRTGECVAVAPNIARVTAANAGPFTFKGTNTFLLGTERLVIIDPGPDDPRHLEALLEAIKGRPVDAILLTHTHRDHCGLARALRERTGAPVWFGGQHRFPRPPQGWEQSAIRRASDIDLEPDRMLWHGLRFAVDRLQIDVYGTPGHCSNHLAFGLVRTPYLFSGDHVMGWSSTLVAPPDGSMGDYLTSLERMLNAPYRIFLPAHGGMVEDGPARARALLSHRQMRNRQIVDAVARGVRTIGGLRRAVYPKQSAALRAAARLTLLAHVDHLAEGGSLTVSKTLFGPRLGIPT